MILTVTRTRLTEKSAIGLLDIEGVFECYTLEPPIDGTPYSATPDGEYELEIYYSPHFGIKVPHVMNVPGKTEIELHMGNYPHDTKDCTLVGQLRAPDAVFNSNKAFDHLMKRLEGQKQLSIVYTTQKEQQ